MNSPAFIVFCSSVLLLAIAFAWAFKTTFKSIINQTTEHATVYSAAYVKATCLIFITMGNTFKETFQPLTLEMVRGFAWWDWVIKLGAPVLAGLAVLVAFLDRSMQRADEVKKLRTDTNPPIPKP